MKSRTINRIITAFAATMSRIAGFFGKSKSYVDPALTDPYARQRTRIGTKANRKGSRRLKAPPCVPGTITYFDWLVKELNYDRRLADGYLYAYLNGYRIKMPMPSDLVSSP